MGWMGWVLGALVVTSVAAGTCQWVKDRWGKGPPQDPRDG